VEQPLLRGLQQGPVLGLPDQEVRGTGDLDADLVVDAHEVVVERTIGGDQAVLLADDDERPVLPACA